mmetsp:Transcript_38933/g.116343  ORF Transcript_38933/g.116343 Transcript_38933/m.116343 type:complete len:247 (+) Transcript_38933:150-890(+)
MVRPARPERCLQELCEHQVVTRQHMSLRVSYWMVRLRARSTTAQTDGRVSELSAMLLANTMWQLSWGGERKTSSCSVRGIIECSAKTRSLGHPGDSMGRSGPGHLPAFSRDSSSGAKASNKFVMSAMPGRKTITVHAGFASCCSNSTQTSTRPSEICGSTRLKDGASSPSLCFPLPFWLPLPLPLDLPFPMPLKAMRAESRRLLARPSQNSNLAEMSSRKICSTGWTRAPTKSTSGGLPSGESEAK